MKQIKIIPPDGFQFSNTINLCGIQIVDENKNYVPTSDDWARSEIFSELIECKYCGMPHIMRMSEWDGGLCKGCGASLGVIR